MAVHRKKTGASSQEIPPKPDGGGDVLNPSEQLVDRPNGAESQGEKAPFGLPDEEELVLDNGEAPRDEVDVSTTNIEDSLRQWTEGRRMEELGVESLPAARLGEKEVTFWDGLREDSPEAAVRRREELGKMQPLVPDFVLENLDKLADGQTRFWRVPGSTIMTIAVLDLSGFTKVTEQELEGEDWTQGAGGGSQKVNQMISRVFGEVQTQAGVAGGQLINLGGDEAVYMFGGTAHQERALHFVSRVKEALEQSDEDISLSGGVASGEVVLGAVRLDEKRSLPLVLGEPIVEARALQGIAAKGDILVHSAVAPRLRVGGVAVRRDVGTALGEYTDFDAVGEYWQERIAHPSPVVPATFDSVTSVARFLHPYDRYHSEFEGMELYGGERRPMTVMFVDTDMEDLHRQVLREVAASAIAQTSEAVRKFEVVLQEVNRVARKYHGNFEKFVLGHDSKLMMLFIKDRKEANALRCAEEVNRLLADNQIESAAGVYTGTGYRGLTGALESGAPKGERGVITPVANRAARLAKRAAVGSILADNLTVAQAEEVLRVRVGQKISQKALGLKGIERDRTIWQVEGVENVESTIEHTNAQSVGRETQKQQMRETFVRVATNKQQIVETLFAEIGEGKSLLTDELVREHYFDKKDAEVVRGKAHEFTQEGAYIIWQAPARKLFRVSDGDSPAAVVEKVRARLGAVGAEYIQYAELFVEEFGLAQLSVPEDQHFPGFNAKAVEVFSALMSQQSKDKPLIAVFEDLHWADHQSNELLKGVIANTKDAAVLFHLVSRPKAGLKEFFRLDAERTTTIELGPIAENYWADFIAIQFPINGMKEYAELRQKGDEGWRRDKEAALFRLMRANERLTQMTYQLSGGNAYLGRLAVKYLLNYHEIHPERRHTTPEGATGPTIQFFEEKDGIFVYKDYIHEKLLPDLKNMDTAYQRMFESVKSGLERVGLKFAAKTGREFRDVELAEQLGVSLKIVSGWLERWEKMGWVEQGAETYSFTHANIQEAIETSIGEVMLEHPDGSRELLTSEVLSRKVGEYKEKHSGSVEDLARLFGASDNIPKGVHYNILAGNIAFARQDGVNYQTAMNYYNRAIALFENNFVEGSSKHNGSTGQRWESLDEKTKSHLVEDALEAYSKLAKVHAMVDVKKEGADVRLQAVELALSRLDKFGEVLATENDRWLLRTDLELLKAGVLCKVNHIADAAELLAKYHELPERLLPEFSTDASGRIVGDVRLRVVLSNYYRLAGVLVYRENFDGPTREQSEVEHYDWALGLAAPEGGFEEFEAWDNAAKNKVVGLRREGRWGEADALIGELLKWETAKGFKAGLVGTKILETEGLVSRGTVEQMVEIRNQLYEILESVRDHAPNREVGLYRALINLEETLHEYGAAKRLVTNFLPILGAVPGEISQKQLINRWKTELAWLAAKEGDVYMAAALMQEIVRADAAAVGRESRSVLPMIEGMLAVHQGEYGASEEAFERSLTAAKAVPGNNNVGLVLVEMALMENKRGNKKAARARLNEAIACYGDEEPIEKQFIEDMLKKIS